MKIVKTLPMVVHAKPVTGPSKPDYVAWGRRLREIRLRSGLTIREVAEKARLDKNTIVAMEMGKRCRDTTWTKVCTVYGVLPISPDAYETSRLVGRHFALHNPNDERWFRIVLEDPALPSVITTSEHIQTEEVRKRFGRWDLASQFFKRLECHLDAGKLRAAVFEVFGPSGWSHQPSGEAFVYGIRGVLKFTVEDESFVLNPGQAASFDRTKRHMHEPGDTMSSDQLPAVFLYVQVD